MSEGAVHLFRPTPGLSFSRFAATFVFWSGDSYSLKSDSTARSVPTYHRCTRKSLTTTATDSSVDGAIRSEVTEKGEVIYCDVSAE